MSDLSGFLSGLTQETLRVIGSALWEEEEEGAAAEVSIDSERAFLIRSRGLRRLTDTISDEKGRAYYQNPYFKVWEREYARRFRVVRIEKVQQ